MTDDGVAGSGDLPDEPGVEPSADQLNKDDLEAAERKFLEAREAWLKERGDRRDE